MIQIISKEALFKAYNLAYKATVFDLGRLNRALGIAQRNSTILLDDGAMNIVASIDDEFYIVRYDKDCQCMDYKIHMRADGDGNVPVRKWNCKHRISNMLIYKALELEAK